MSEKKVVDRKVAIALGIICVVLAVGLVGVVAYYTSIISGLNSQVSQLQTWLQENITHYESQITSLRNQIADKDNTIASLNSQINQLQSQVDEFRAIVNLEKSETWVSQQTVSQPAGGYYSWKFSASYAGYIVVTVHSSTTSNTYVRVIWSSYGVIYDKTVNVGVGGAAAFPVLPCSRVEIRVGNTNLLSGATQTVSITYRY
jgi:uncharacterized coiled-coil protein SlyX